MFVKINALDPLTLCLATYWTYMFIFTSTGLGGSPFAVFTGAMILFALLKEVTINGSINSKLVWYFLILLMCGLVYIILVKTQN